MACWTASGLGAAARQRLCDMKRVCRFLRKSYIRFCRMVDRETPRTDEEIKWWAIK